MIYIHIFRKKKIMSICSQTIHTFHYCNQYQTFEKIIFNQTYKYFHNEQLLYNAQLVSQYAVLEVFSISLRSVKDH